MTQSIIICQVCKTENRGDARFCSECGKQLSVPTIPASDKSELVEIFISYSHADESWKNQLLTHMSVLGRGRADRAIVWHDRDIQASDNWRREIDAHLVSAAIIILLISASFIASDYCYSNEMKAAMKRHEKGEAKVVPIIVRPVVWEETPFHKLQSLPHNAKPVSKWSDSDDAWVNIIKEIKRIL